MLTLPTSLGDFQNHERHSCDRAVILHRECGIPRHTELSLHQNLNSNTTSWLSWASASASYREVE